MSHNKPVETVERETLCAVKDWRAADRQHVADKGDNIASKKEYQARKLLRTAADALTEAHHG